MVHVTMPEIVERMALNIENGQTGSAFMIDVSQVSLALRRATSRSLLVIDEFGKGARACFALFEGIPVTSTLYDLGGRYQPSRRCGLTSRMHQEPG